MRFLKEAGANAVKLEGPRVDLTRRLVEAGITYAPDFVVNAGGIINVAAEILHIEDPAPWVANKLRAIETTIERILARAEAEAASPAHLADRIVEDRMLARAG